MHPALIQAALKIAGVSQAEIARRCTAKGVSESLVGQVIQGRCRSKRVETCIAAATGILPSELWPQWYGPDAAKRDRPPRAQIQAALAQIQSLAKAS